jgi:hypothetical protein
MMIVSRIGSSVRFKVVSTFLCALTLGGVSAEAQQGDNAVWASHTAQIASSAFIDASVFSGDICAKIFTAIGFLPTAGGVVDARGVNPGTSQLCTSGTPWVQVSAGVSKPSVVLLPSGSITISKPWKLPNGTKIIGEGAGAPGSGVTTIQPCTIALGCSTTFSGTLIQMGPNSADSPLIDCFTLGGCTEIGVEDLALDGGTNGANISGIVNGQSQDMSYVRRVSMYRIGGVGLKIWAPAQGSPQNSGPYSDITFDAGSSAGSASTICVEILSSSTVNISTRGIRGLSCKSESGTVPTLAVQLDASNNLVKDVRIQGFGDGIVVGKTQNASSDVLFNITGGGTSVVNSSVVHLATGHTVKDISIMGVINSGTSSNAINDELTSTTLSDSIVGMYVLGESVSIGGTNVAYSRFTTSTNINAVTWGAGNVTPSGNCSNNGSLFAATGGTGSLGLFVCNGSWTPF